MTEQSLQKSQGNPILTPTDLMASPRHALTELSARFAKDLTDPREVKRFFGVCLAVGLNPFLDEITVYQGRYYIQEAGWMTLIGRRAPGQLRRCEAAMATEEERQEFGAKPDDILAKCTVVRVWPEGQTSEFTAYAAVTRAEMTPKPGRDAFRPIEKEPGNMALKRARVRALRLAFRDVLSPRFDHAVYNDGALDVDKLAASEEMEVPAPPPQEAPAAVRLDLGLKHAANAARGGFWARVKELGIAHSAVHEALGLSCEGKHEDEPDYDAGPPCRALSQQIAAWVAAGDTEAGAWVRMRERLEEATSW